VNQPSPLTPVSGNSLQMLNQALQSNSQAYGGELNQLQNQYQQNLGNVQQNLVNSGLNNTTVAQNMAQAPLQTYNNGVLNVLGQQQGAATGIYGTASQEALQAAMAAQANAQQNSAMGTQNYYNTEYNQQRPNVQQVQANV
jgi:hypothetical protein